MAKAVRAVRVRDPVKTVHSQERAMEGKSPEGKPTSEGMMEGKPTPEGMMEGQSVHATSTAGGG
jgi:hypothetical protein